MRYWRICCSVISTFVAVTSVLVSPAEGIDSQDRDGRENGVNDSSKNNTPLINTHAVTATTTPVTVAAELCKDPSGYVTDKCSPDLPCDQLPKYCFDCDFNCTCIYGQEVEVSCRVAKKAKPEFCKIRMNMTCRYCYQTEPWEHTCEGRDSCQAISSPRELFTSNCTVNSDVLCLGNRSFPKRLPCNWTSGYKWSTALLLSITLGGFGADRFYLGLWQEGIGKLFSFGGLGVWTIMDVILIAIRYLGPADGSLYI